MNGNDFKHLSLGSLTRTLHLPSMNEAKHYAKLGAGVVAGSVGTNMAVDRLAAAIPSVAGVIPPVAMPFVKTALGIAAGGIIAKKLDKDAGAGFIAGAASIAAAAVIQMVLDKVAPSVAQETAPATEGMSGLGRLPAGSHIYGVGTPDVGAARMFAGATVAMEEVGGPMAGATIQFEPTSNFAGAIN